MCDMLQQTICTLLTPLIRLLQRKGIAFGEFSELAKQVYVDVATELLVETHERPSTSRIAIATGLTRKEVAALRRMPTAETPNLSYNRGAKVMTGWLHDKEFQDEQGQPALLPIQGEKGSFVALVNRYSGDMPYRAMLQEMERVGAIAITAQNSVQLLGGGYIPHADETEKLAILGTDVAALINTIEHNLSTPEREQLYFQRKVSYDNLPEEALPVFRSLVNEQGMDLLIRLNEWLMMQDRDSNPHGQGTGRMRAGVGIYYFQEPVKSDTAKDN